MHGSHENLDVLEFLAYLNSRRLVFILASTVAVVLALVVSLLLPKRYTATSTILIEAPGGNDSGAAIGLAASDTLFLQALDRLQARDANANTPIESLKQSVLKVSRRPNTAILEISATWNDPRKAQALAQYIAEQTVALSKSIDARWSEEALKEIRDETQAALEVWTRVRQKRDALMAANPIATLENEVADGARFGSLLERDLELAKADLAELSAQQTFGDTDQNRRQAAAARARVAVFDDQRRELNERLEKITTQLEVRRSRRAALDNDEHVAHASYDTLQAKLNDMLSWSRLRGEHLQIIDPGIVPRQPSSPNMRLNVFAALLASLVASSTFVVFRFSYMRLLRESAERVYSLR